jgi:hypothetical protein
MTGPLDCAAMEEYSEEFALGLLDGAGRAAVVAHLEGCRSCGAHVALLAEAGEQLLLLAPLVEPPVGFEQRVLERVVPPAAALAQSGQSGPRHLRRRPERRRSRWLGSRFTTLGAVAAALVLVVGVAAVLIGGRDNAPAEVSAQMISAHGEGAVGKAAVVDARPMVVELYMSRWLDEVNSGPIPPPPGPWTVAVDRAGGAHEEHTVEFSRDPTPTFKLHPGDKPVRRLSVQDSTGHVWCWADFSTTV